MMRPCTECGTPVPMEDARIRRQPDGYAATCEPCGQQLSDQALREAVFALDGGMCAWPGCGLPATESAHLTSKGMGGSKHRNTAENAFAACADHARISDGSVPDGPYGLGRRDAEYMKVPGVHDCDVVHPGVDVYHPPRTRDVIENLRIYIMASRKRRDWLERGQSQLFGTNGPTGF